MTKAELIQYIKNAIDLETELATQDRIFKEANKHALETKPKLQYLPAPKKPAYPHVEPFTFRTSRLEFIARAVGIFFLYIGILALSRIRDTGASILIPLLFVLLGLLLFIPFIRGKINHEKKLDWADECFETETEQFEKTLLLTQQENTSREATYQQNHADWQKSTDELSRYLSKPYNETKELLARYYSKDIIYPKYQTLPALTSIYEYLITGRCEELTGPHGAYNLYEDEVRKDTIISRLDAVIENLEQIRNSQYMLYQQVKTIQEDTQAIASELAQIKGCTLSIAQLSAMTAYYAKLTERNTRISMYCDL